VIYNVALMFKAHKPLSTGIETLKLNNVNEYVFKFWYFM